MISSGTPMDTVAKLLDMKDYTIKKYVQFYINTIIESMCKKVFNLLKINIIKQVFLLLFVYLANSKIYLQRKFINNKEQFYERKSNKTLSFILQRNHY